MSCFWEHVLSFPYRSLQVIEVLTLSWSDFFLVNFGTITKINCIVSKYSIKSLATIYFWNHSYLRGTTGEKVWGKKKTTICTCHNFPPPLSSVQIIIYQLVAYCVCFKMIIKILYRHLFLEDIAKHARVTQEITLPNL